MGNVQCKCDDLLPTSSDVNSKTEESKKIQSKLSIINIKIHQIK